MYTISAHTHTYADYEANPSRVNWEQNLLILSLVNVLITEIKSHTEIFKSYKFSLKRTWAQITIIIALLLCTAR